MPVRASLRALLRALVPALVVGLTASGCGGPLGFGSGSHDEPGSPVPTPARLQWGVADSTRDGAEVVARSSGVLDRRPDIVEHFVSLGLRRATLLHALEEIRDDAAAGTTVLLTLEPAESGDDATLRAVADGRADTLLQDVAHTLAGFRVPVALRFAHEMNGSWYAWAGDPDTYVRAWRRVHATIGGSAPSVAFVWSPSAFDRPADRHLEDYWPGGRLVDIVGLDAYNCLAGWVGPEQLFGQALDRVAALAPGVPVWITETATCEASDVPSPAPGSSKEQWITALFALARERGVGAIVWFDRDKEYDWRVDTSPGATRALRRALAQP